jgi:geranylgeranyl reductase family protein
MITIAGASIAGNNLAWKLAQKGHQVTIFEDHPQIGLPLHCTGVVTYEFENAIEPKKEFIVNYIKRIKLVAPNKKETILSLRKPELILDRPAFDNYLANKAMDSGAKIMLNTRFMDLKGNKAIVRERGQTKEINFDIHVGAEGAKSRTAEVSGLEKERHFYIGLESKAKIDVDPGTFECYFGKDFPEFFGWVVPEDEGIVRIGIAAKKDTPLYYERFLRERLGKDYKERIFHKQAGLIVQHNPSMNTSKENLFLVGDAATQNKTTTGGGIIPALICSNTLADCIIGGKSYDEEWRKKLGRELWLHLKLRKVMDKFTDNDYNRLVEWCGREKVKGILESESRDFPSRFLLKLALSEPRLAIFARHLYNAVP